MVSHHLGYGHGFFSVSYSSVSNLHDKSVVNCVGGMYVGVDGKQRLHLKHKL